MTLAIDITDEWGFSNEARHELLAKEEQGTSVLAIHFTIKASLA